MSGTSMALPAMAGTLALLWRAKPELPPSAMLLERLAVRIDDAQCGAGYPNNVYGYPTEVGGAFGGKESVRVSALCVA
jgi:hypothetical protein